MNSIENREFVEWCHEEKAKLPEPILRLARLARFDVLFGPISEADDGEYWPGFESACDQIHEALSSIHVDDVWSDGGYIVTSEPEPFEDEESGEMIEPYCGDITTFSRSDVRKQMFGELADYLC